MEATMTITLMFNFDKLDNEASLDHPSPPRNSRSYSMSYVAVCRSVDICVMCAVLWVLACIVAYGRRTGKWKATSSKTNVDGGRIYIACLVAVFLTFPRLVMAQIVFHAPHLPFGLERCEILIDLTVVGYFVSAFSTYFFLWTRQRIIYRHPTIQASVGRWANVVSIAILPVLVLVSLGALCAFVIPESYIARSNGCYERQPGNGTAKADKWDAVENHVIGGLSMASQSILLLLFIYPMIKMRKTGNRKRSKRVASVIQRSVVCATIAVVSDVLVAALVAQAVPRDKLAVVGITLYDINIAINVFCMMGTFDNVGDIFLVFCKPNHAIIRRRSSTSSRDREIVKQERHNVV